MCLKRYKNQIIIIAACIATCCYFSYWLGSTNSPFIFFNTSLLGVLIAATAVFIMPAFKLKALFFGFNIAVLAAIVFTGSRVGLLAWIVGILLVSWFNGLFKGVKQNHLLTITGVSFSILFISLTFLFKTDSTQGRWFIWQNSFTLIKEHWLAGVGWGQFRVAYNNEQANWFIKHGLQQKETMLADIVYYGFNEWLQLSVEIGVPITLTILLLIIYVLLRSFKNVMNPGSSYTQQKVIAAFTALLFSTFFSYPFYYLPTLLLFCFLFLCLIQIAGLSFIEQLSLTVKKVAVFSLLVLVVVFLFIQSYARLQWKQANELISIVYKKQALIKMKTVYPVLRLNGDYLFTLATVYSSLNKKDSALFFMEKSAITKNDYEINRKLGQLYMETGNKVLAEKHFLNAIYMVPNRFKSRELLVDCYVNSGKTKEALFWAGQTVHLKEKIPSATTRKIKERMRNYIAQGIW